MKASIHFLISCLFGFVILVDVHAQEGEIDVEESAEVFLEEYSDEFQEAFFEALKQKGIENYDRAINLLLKCKNLDPINKVVDSELAKAYYASKKYVSAQEYAINAVSAAPENIWYLNTLVDIIQKQGTTIESVSAQIPFTNIKLKENLATVYYNQKKYNKALNILKSIKKSDFTEILTSKIKDSIDHAAKPNAKGIKNTVVEREVNPVEELKLQIEGLLVTKSDFKSLESLSLEAMESFPSQPYFYYVNGLALNKNGKSEEAVEILELALDYILDDVDLMNKVYHELANAFNALGNSGKANNYLSKIKSGL